MTVADHQILIGLTGIMLILLVVPKNRHAGFGLLTLLAVYAMFNLLDWQAVNLPSLNLAGDPLAVVPVLVVTGLLVGVVLAIGRAEEHGDK